MPKPENSYCWNWCVEDHPNHHPSIGDRVIIVDNLVHGLEGYQAIVIREARGTESGDVLIMLTDEYGVPTTTCLTVGYTEIGPTNA